MNHCYAYWGRSISYPLEMTGIRTLKFLPAPYEKRNPEGLFFVGTFEKLSEGSNFDRLLWRKKSELPVRKPVILIQVMGEGVRIKMERRLETKEMFNKPRTFVRGSGSWGRAWSRKGEACSWTPTEEWTGRSGWSMHSNCSRCGRVQLKAFNKIVQ